MWLRDAGYATAHIGKYLNGYGTRAPRQVPAGWQEWYGSVDPTTYNFRNYCLNENGTLRRYGRPRRAPARAPSGRPQAYQGDLYTAQGGRLHQPARARRAALLPVGRLSGAARGGPNPVNGRCRGSAKPADRHRARFAERRAAAAARLQRAARARQAGVHPAPQPLHAGRDRAIRTDYQCRRESLLAIDEGVALMVDALRRSGELDNTVFVFTADNGFFQGEHRVPRGKIKPYEPRCACPR